MKSRWERWRTSGPAKRPTLREVVVTVVACAGVIGVLGLIFGRWDSLIGGGVIGVGVNLWSQWLAGHTAQPEYEEEDNDG